MFRRTAVVVLDERRNNRPIMLGCVETRGNGNTAKVRDTLSLARLAACAANRRQEKRDENPDDGDYHY
jgi:hypothetical protein